MLSQLLPPESAPAADLIERILQDQDQVLQQIDALNTQIEAVLKEFAPAREAPADRLAFQPADQRQAA